MRFTPKRVLNFSGSMLALSSIVFVVIHLYEYGLQINFTYSVVFVRVIWFAIVYGLSNLMLAFAWWQLLVHFGEKPHIHWALHTYSASQLAKYLPGNIFHFATRQAMGMAAGITGWVLVKSSILELVLISVAGVLFIFLTLPLLYASISVPSAFGLFIISFVIIVSIAGHYIGVTIARTLVLYVGFLFVSGLLFCGLSAFVAHNYLLVHFPWHWISLTGAYVTAWLIGLVTPGAPAGVGVREMVLIFLLRDTMNNADLISTVVFGRIMTVGGDLFFYIVFFILKQKLLLKKISARLAWRK